MLRLEGGFFKAEIKCCCAAVIRERVLKFGGLNAL